MSQHEVPTDRIARLEVKTDNLHSLTVQIADTSSNTAKALQELVLIHREGSVKAENDREIIGTMGKSLDLLWGCHRDLSKSVWRYIAAGAGGFSVIAMVWASGLLPALVRSGGGL